MSESTRGRSATPSLKLKRGRPSLEQEAEISATILSVAATLFLEKGYEATSIEAIAKSAGIYKNAVYKRFPNKQALFIDVFQAKLEEWDGLAKQWRIKSGDTLEEKLVNQLLRAAKWSMHSEVRAFRRLRTSVGQESQGLLQEMRSIGLKHHAGLIEREIIECTTREGKPARHPDKVAHALLAILATWIEEKPIDTDIKTRDVRKFAQQTVELICNGKLAW